MLYLAVLPVHINRGVYGVEIVWLGSHDWLWTGITTDVVGWVSCGIYLSAYGASSLSNAKAGNLDRKSWDSRQG